MSAAMPGRSVGRGIRPHWGAADAALAAVGSPAHHPAGQLTQLASIHEPPWGALPGGSSSESVTPGPMLSPDGFT